MKEDLEVMHDFSWAHRPVEWPWWIWALATGVILFALTAAALLWIKHRRKKTSQPSSPAIPAHITALEALRKLEVLLNEDHNLEFVIEVSRILRVYIQDRFQLRAPHRSTEEFLWEASESSHLGFEYQVLLGDFLKTCDRVKFAKRQVVLLEMRELFDTARRFVMETMEKTEISTSGAKN